MTGGALQAVKIKAVTSKNQKGLITTNNLALDGVLYCVLFAVNQSLISINTSLVSMSFAHTQTIYLIPSSQLLLLVEIRSKIPCG